MSICIWLVLCAFPVHGLSVVDTDVSVMEGGTVSLKTDIIKTQLERIKWYFNGNRIAEIHGDQSKLCEDDECPERFRDRLKLDHQTGSLIIMNTRITDSGLYELQITSRRSEKKFSVTVHGSLGADTDGVSEIVIEGNSVTLKTDIIKTQLERIKWYFNGTRIAEINGDQSKICEDDACPERFRDRLKLDHQTGSLIIMNTRITDTGLYQLQIISRNSEKNFNVDVLGVSAVERDEMKRKSVKEGESVILDPGVTKNPNDLMTWHFNDTFIAEINRDQSKICTDVQCKERFRDRLKLDHQTGSLTITNTRTTDSGVYTLHIFSSDIKKSFSVTVTDSGLSSGAITGISVVAVLLLVVAAAGIYLRCSKKTKDGSGGSVTDGSRGGLQQDQLEMDKGTRTKDNDKMDGVPPPNESETMLMNTMNVMSPEKNEPQSMDTSNEMSHDLNEPQSMDTSNGPFYQDNIPYIDEEASEMQ
ncbi:cell adhesion molecule CEACAM3-like [Siphateles boraxobius]|uniref:cell adhesion molecule CEACAM3-like n=1 Tax=Siphateles boraxobius TaxID=180520 RepID=UPI0040640DE0